MADAALEPHPELNISFLRADTPDPHCTSMADELYDKFTAPHARHPEHGAYQDGCSILVLPATFDEYWNGPAGYYTRRKVRRALKEGYTFGRIDRDAYVEDIFAINTSLAERQGKEMTERYRARPGGRAVGVGTGRGLAHGRGPVAEGDTDGRADGEGDGLGLGQAPSSRRFHV